MQRKRSGKIVEQVTAYLPPDLAKQARHLAVDQGLELSDVIVDALRRYLQP
jgi:hypothetical protein